jgi:hypothetical protein
VRLVGDLMPLVFPWGRSHFVRTDILYGKQQCHCQVFCMGSESVTVRYSVCEVKVSLSGILFGKRKCLSGILYGK